jgi:HlyD family secretion protein
MRAESAKKRKYAISLWVSIRKKIRMSMKQKLRPLVILVILGAIGGGIWFWQSKRDTASDNELLLYGNVDIRQVELAFNDSERVADLLAEEGDRLKKGQLLAKLETERFELAVARADAQVKNQEQVVARLEAGTRPEEIRKAKADVAAGEAALDDAERTYKRISVLVPQKAASVQNLDDARAAVNSARARLNALNAVLDLAIAGPRKEDIAAAKALLQRYEAELALARRDLKNALLYAPTDGIVQNRILEVGDMASPQKPVYTVALTDPLWVRAYISEPDLGKIREGMKAVVTTDSFPNKQYEGRIGFISPTAEFTPKPVETTQIRTKLVYQVRVFVKNPNDELRLGMPATVRVQLDQPRPIKDQPSTADSAAGQIQ